MMTGPQLLDHTDHTHTVTWNGTDKNTFQLVSMLVSVMMLLKHKYKHWPLQTVCSAPWCSQHHYSRKRTSGQYYMDTGNITGPPSSPAGKVKKRQAQSSLSNLTAAPKTLHSWNQSTVLLTNWLQNYNTVRRWGSTSRLLNTPPSIQPRSSPWKQKQQQKQRCAQGCGRSRSEGGPAPPGPPRAAGSRGRVPYKNVHCFCAINSVRATSWICGSYTHTPGRIGETKRGY